MRRPGLISIVLAALALSAGSVGWAGPPAEAPRLFSEQQIQEASKPEAWQALKGDCEKNLEKVIGPDYAGCFAASPRCFSSACPRTPWRPMPGSFSRSWARRFRPARPRTGARTSPSPTGPRARAPSLPAPTGRRRPSGGRWRPTASATITTTVTRAILRSSAERITSSWTRAGTASSSRSTTIRCCSTTGVVRRSGSFTPRTRVSGESELRSGDSRTPGPSSSRRPTMARPMPHPMTALGTRSKRPGDRSFTSGRTSGCCTTRRRSLSRPRK